MSKVVKIILDCIDFDHSPEGHVPLYKDFSLEVLGGEVTVIVGPSGVGKSTLLDLIAGMVRPLSGSIRFYGVDRQVPRPPIGFVFQNATLIPWRSVLSNVVFGAEIQGDDPRRKLEERALVLIEKFGLKHCAGQFPFQLSGGMQQRVAIARALLSGAGVLLLDEPFSNSDFVTRRDLQIEVSRGVDVEKLVAILVTHDLHDALRIGDRILVASGRPVEILDSFSIDIPRQDRLSEQADDVGLLHPYLERIWQNWMESHCRIGSDA